jgi:hypothetical protein
MASLELKPIEDGGVARVEVPHQNWFVPEIELDDGVVTVHFRARVHEEREGGFLSNLWPLGWGSMGQAVIYVPNDVHGRIHTEMGRIRAHDLEVAELELSSSGGAILVRHVHGALKLHTEAGKVEGRGLSGAIFAETQAGAVHLDIDALSPGSHVARTQVGAVRIDLAPGIAVDIKAHTELGKARVTYPTQPGAAAVLKVSTEVGAVQVRERRGTSDADFASWSDSAGRGRAGAPPPTPGPEIRKVLDLVAEGKVSPADAEQILKAMNRH